MEAASVRKKVLVIYRDSLETGPYSRALAAVGLDPVLVEVRPGVRLDNYSGLLLTGGSDVNPARYGEAIAPQTDPPDQERDALESALIGLSLDRDLPLLAICRGLQILNVHLGGSLAQHLELTERHRSKTRDYSVPAHDVRIEPGTLLASIAGQDTWFVNSRHHQAALRAGRGLRVSATDPQDGTIEAIEMPDRRFVLAVQWHPEDQALTDPRQLSLFRAFAAAL